MDVVLGEGTKDNEFSRLLEFATLHIDIRDACSAFASGIEIDAGNVAERPIGEVVLREQRRKDRGLGRRLRVVATGKPFAKAAVGALTHLHAVGVLVRLRRVRGRAWKRLETDFLCCLVEKNGCVAAFERRQRIGAGPRTLERVAAGLYLALEVASLPEIPQRYSNLS